MTVPAILQGAWKRRWIKYADGRFDESSIVIWLQFESDMVDVRLSPELAALETRSSLAECDAEDLLLLADGDSSSGTTTCTPILADEKGLRTATAEWHSTRALQPETSFPEAGLLKWNADASIMMERAPSGAYLEQWNRVRNTGPDHTPSRIDHRDDGSSVYLMGSLAVLAHDRRSGVPEAGRLVDLVRASADPTQAQALVDCEFSVAQSQAGKYVITASTHPWRIGEELDV